MIEEKLTREELKAELEKIVAAFDEERNTCNYTSDNTGDVYSAGVENGELYLAKKILETYFS